MNDNGGLFDPLTARETEILILLARGLSDKEIADKLFLGTGTVKWHLKNIYSKFNLHKRTAVIARARELGLLRFDADEAASVPLPVRPKHNLPSQTTTFIGRETDMSSILSLLTNEHCRLVTLVGVGGIGKTRLAVQCAGRLLGVFDNSVYYLNLDSVSANLLPSSIADVLNFRTVGKEDLRLQLLRFLRDKKLLFILDSFEHLIAEEAAFLVQILNAAPEIKMIVTSREVLNLAEEWLYPVDGLTFPNNQAAENPESFGAIKLFTDRAVRINHDFSIIAESQSVIQICQAVGGMPLAIELLTTWLNVLSCAEIAVELARNRDMLAAERRDLPPRQQSVRIVFDQSWNLLSLEEQAVFMKASVFRGGFTRDAVGDVAGASLRSIAALVNKSLISANKQGRYGLHLLLRHYAEEKLREVVSLELESRLLHSRYYAGVLLSTTPADDELLWQDADNIWAGWAYAVAQKQHNAIAGYVHGLWNHFELRKWHLVDVSILNLYQDSILIFEQSGMIVSVLKTLRELYESLANFLYAAQRYTEARAAYQSALTHALQVDDRVMHARLYRKIASTHASQRNEVDAMFEMYQQAENALEEVTSDVEHAWWTEWIEIKLELGWAHYTRMDVSKMTGLLEEIESPVQQRGTPAQVSRFYFNKVLIDFRKYRFHHLPNQSLQNVEISLKAALQANDLRELGLIEQAKAFVHLWCDEIDEAELHYENSIKRIREFGDTLGSLATALTYFPLIYRRRQQVDLVEHWARQGLDAATEANTPVYIGISLGHLGWIEYRRGNDAAARAFCEKAVNTWEQTAFPIPMHFTARIPLLALLLRQNDIAQAVDNARVLIDVKQKQLHDPLPELLTQAINSWEVGDPAAAVTALHQFCERCVPLGYL